MRRLTALITLTVALVVTTAAAAATIVGTPRNDQLRGTARADTLIGRGGNDRLLGLGGNDRLNGGPGNDTLSGGPGTDAISCGPGTDTVLAAGGDRVATDCELVRGLPTVSVADASVAEGDAGATRLAIPVTLSGPVAHAVSVAYSTADGTATAPVDYAAASGRLTFAPGETTRAIEVTVNGDRTFEPDETLRVTLSTPSQATLGTPSATGTIRNDDQQLPRSGRYTGTTSQGNPISFDVTAGATAVTNLRVLVDIVCAGVGQFNDLELGTSGAIPLDAGGRFELTLPVSGSGITGALQLQGGVAAPGSASGFLRLDMVVSGVRCTTNNVTWTAS